MAIPFSLTLPASPPGTGGGIIAKRRVLAATASNPFCRIAPPMIAWGRSEQKANHGRSEATTFRRRISDWHAQTGMFGRGNRPSPTLWTATGRCPGATLKVTLRATLEPTLLDNVEGYVIADSRRAMPARPPVRRRASRGCIRGGSCSGSHRPPLVRLQGKIGVAGSSLAAANALASRSACSAGVSVDQ